MRTALFIAGGCVALLGGALVLAHLISTPEQVSYELPPAAPTAAPLPLPPPAVTRRTLTPPAPGEAYAQRPEFDTADAVLADPNASNDSVRDAAGLFSRCVQYEPGNSRCVASLARAQARVAALPPDPVAPPVAVQDLRLRGTAETITRKRDLTRFRTLPALKGNQFIEGGRTKPVDAPQ